jgi:riboflavin biosynthesis pyrimidine reductase
LLVEGGSKLLQSFVDSNLWDDARIEISHGDMGETRHLAQEQKVVAPTLRYAEVCEEYHVDGNKLLILLNSRHI